MTYYLKGLNEVFRGGNLEIKDKYSFNSPEITSDKDWNVLVAELLKAAKEFAELISGFEDEKLEAPFVNEEYGSYQRNIEAMIEHGYYHLGQVVLLRKLLEDK